ncbi:MAG: efflux RND transporter periplasmic adaptor subunit [Suipraeoptans sp.]
MKKKILRKKVMIPVGIVAAFILLIVIAAIRVSSGAKDTASVDMEAVKARDIKEVFDASGTIESKKSKVFYCPVNAPISAMTHGLGEAVKSGELLISFDTKNLERDNQKAALNVKSGEQAYADAVNQANQAAAMSADASNQASAIESALVSKEQEIKTLTAQIEATKQNAVSAAQSENDVAMNDYNNQLNEAKGKVSTAQKTYDELNINYNMAYDKWNAANTNGSEKAMVDELAKEVTSIGTQLSDAQTTLSNAQSEETVLENNPPTQTSGEADVSGMESDLQGKQGELSSLQAQYDSLSGAGASGDASGGSGLGQLQTTTNLAELEKKTSQELVEEGRKGISCDFDGIVSDVQAQVGSTATQGQQLITVSSTNEVGVKISVSKYEYENLKEGQEAEIAVANKKYKGSVTKIDKIAIPNDKGTPMIGVEVTIDNPDKDIYLGVETKVKITSDEKKNVPSISNMSVNEDKNGTFCYVVRDGKVKKQKIEKGAVSSEFAEIKSGLKVGDKVIADPEDYDEGDVVEEGK